MALPRQSRCQRNTAICVFLFVLSFVLLASEHRNRHKDENVDRNIRMEKSENSVLIMKKKYDTSPSTYAETSTSSQDTTTVATTCPPTPDVDPFINVMQPLPELRPVFTFSLTPWKVSDPILFNETPDPGVRWSIIVMIKSHSKNLWERRIARLTWGQREYFNGVRMKMIFIVGKAANAEAEMALLKENGVFGDLLQLDREEKYIDVIYKTLAGMQYAGTHFPCDWIYTSADDDIMPDLKQMQSMTEQHILSKIQHDQNDTSNSTCDDKNLQILCGFGGVIGAVPRRNAKDKWFVSEALYSLKKFPPYCMGAWYSMRVQYALDLYEISRKFPFFWIDDIWVTGILRLKYLYDNSDSCPSNALGDGLPVQKYRERFVVMGESTTLLQNWQNQYEKVFQQMKC